MDLLCIRIAFAVSCLIAATGVEASGHWAYQPVTRPSVPSVDNFSWASGEMDCFILAKLRENGMRPARRANRRVLIRRVTLDLTGLPPASGEVDRFVVDDSPGHTDVLLNGCWLHRVLVSAGADTGSTWPVMPTPRATLQETRRGSSLTRTPTATM